MNQVTVTYHHEEGQWWAEALELEGFTVVGRSFAEVQQLVSEGVAFYLNDAPFSLVELLDSGATLVGATTSTQGLTYASWSSKLASAWNSPMSSNKVGATQFA